MTITRLLLGMCLLAIALGPLSVASVRWCRVLLPSWSGAPLALASSIVLLAAVVCSQELLGAFGVLRVAPTVVFLAAMGGAGLASARRYRVRNQADAVRQLATLQDEPAQYPLWANLAALGAVCLVTADWCTRTVDALHHGMSTPDTLWYHMPLAARFAEQGTIIPLHFVDTGVSLGSVIPFYPANGELFHTLGILLLGSDFLSVLLNLGWLALAFLASWCLGRPYGVAPITLAGCAVLMAVPGFVATQPGGAYTDIVGVALLAAAAALLVNGDRTEQLTAATGISALAAGLALGTKFTFIAPVAALTCGVIFVAPRRARLRIGILWVALTLLAGGFWYGRNLWAIGNPLPSNLTFGPIHLTGPPQPASTTFATFMFRPEVWRHWYLPGFRASLGPMWWTILALAGAGLVVGLFNSASRMTRMLSIAGLISATAFVLTPQLLTLPPAYPHAPYNFAYNLRYSFAALLFGLMLLPIAPMLRARRTRVALLSAYVAITALMQLDGVTWPSHVLSVQFGLGDIGFPPIQAGDNALFGLVVGFSLFVLGASYLLMRSRGVGLRWKRPGVLVPGVVMVILVVVAAVGVERLYLRDRYRQTFALSSLYSWAQQISKTRIAMTGPGANGTYPLYGQDASNYVQALGVPGPHGSFAPVTNCHDFRTTVDAGHYRDVVTVTSGNHSQVTRGMPASWAMQAGTAHRIFTDITGPFHLTVTVVRLSGPLDPHACPPQ